MYKLLITCSFLIISFLNRGYSNTYRDSMRLHTDFCYINESGKLVQEFYYQIDSTTRCTINFSCYKFNTLQDSILVYSKSDTASVLLKGGHHHSILLNFSTVDDFTSCNTDFYNVLKKVQVVPAGRYRIYIRLHDTSGNSTSRSFEHIIDSNLNPNSGLRKDINNMLLPQSGKKLWGTGLTIVKNSLNHTYDNAGKLLHKNRNRLDRMFRRKGLSTRVYEANGKEYTDIFYNDWYVGRYDAEINRSLTDQLRQQQEQLKHNTAGLTGNNLENGTQTIFSQVRKLLQQDKEQSEINGEIALSAYLSNGQQEYSETDNNYSELHGMVEVPLLGVPVGIEGYYTTQDRNRKVKASYIRLHYDAEKAKSKLAELIGSYKKQYNQTVGKASSMDMVYKNYLNNLNNQKSSALAELKKEAGISEFNLADTAGLKKQITDNITQSFKDSLSSLGDTAVNDTSGVGQDTAQLRAITDSAQQVYEKAVKQYERIKAVEADIDKYNALFQQYKNANYFDSIRSYEQLKDIQDMEQMSYKQMAKKASDMLPEGKAKQFITGVTHFDIGMFPQYTSKYTIAGQQMKGLDLGYDLGFCTAGITVGNTQYAGRDGTLDKYTSYAARASFRLGSKQELGLVYYGYMPSRSMLNDEQFFKNVDIALPGFKKPVHIASLIYSGQVSKYIRVNSELATSYRNNNNPEIQNASLQDRLAYTAGVEANIPKTTLTIATSAEHTGRYFENSSLPVSLAGMDLYRAKANGVFFGSFLLLGIEFNYREQTSFSSRAYNTKWGFDIKTTSKRYPSVALSYRPFTTFRSYFDTLNVPQRPMNGDVWSGRLSYQFKKMANVLRVTLSYNKNNSESDTIRYGSDMLQLTALYNIKRTHLSVNIGSMNISGNNLPAITMANARTQLAGAQWVYQLTDQVTLNTGLETGFARKKISKYGMQLGTAYRFTRIPLNIRANFRYTNYQLQESVAWQAFYAGTIDLIWHFKTKVF